MLYAIIDIGSNTIRMAVYDISVISGKEKVEMLYKDKQMVGLAAFVENSIMNRDGIEQVCKVLGKFKLFLKKLNIQHVIAFTTAALRNCSNSNEAVAEITKQTGIEIKVVSGEEEAELDFVGATHGQRAASGILVDIGGGSTELVHYNSGHIINKVSLPIGSLGYRKKYVAGLLPTEQEIQKMRAATSAEIKEKAGEFTELVFDEICGIGGTFKGTWSLYQNIIGKANEKEGTFAAENLNSMMNRFQEGKLDEEDTLLLLRSIPERLETVLPGMIIASVLVDIFRAKRITYSDTGMREGFIYKEIIPNLL